MDARKGALSVGNALKAEKQENIHKKKKNRDGNTGGRNVYAGAVWSGGERWEDQLSKAKYTWKRHEKLLEFNPIKNSKRETEVS